MRHISGSPCIAQSAHERHKSEYPHQVFEPDGEWKREHEYFLIAKKHCGSHKDCIDSAGSANGCSLRNQMNDVSEGVSKSNRTQTRPNYTKKEKLQKAPASPGNFKHGAKHPQHEHVEEQVKETRMKESVGQKLINMSMNNVMCPQGQRVENGIGQISLTHSNEYQAENVDAGVDCNQRLDGPRERRE